MSWPGSARDFSLCGSHTPTRAGALLCVPTRAASSLGAATRPHSHSMISRINLGCWWKGCESSQRSSLFMAGGALSGVVGVLGGWRRVVCWGKCPLLDRQGLSGGV